MEYTVGLALEDFLPVIFSSVGLLLLSRLIGRFNARLGQMALVGWLFVTVGGVFKASWKLMMALSDTRINIVWMDKGMFLWMAIGFTLLATAMWYFDEGQTRDFQSKSIWIVPTIIFGLTFVAILFTGFPDFEISTWRFILLGIMTLGNVILVVLLIQMSRRHQLTLSAFLLLTSIIIVFMLSGMARIPEQTIALQWVEQILNTISQGGFAYAIWTLSQTIQSPTTTMQPTVS